MKRLLLLLILLPSMLCAQSFADRWKTVDALMEKNLPRSVIEEVEAIYDEALKIDDFPQIVKASFVLLDMYAQLSSDSIDGRLKDIEKIVAKRTAVADRAVVHALMGDSYKRFASRFYANKDKYDDYITLSEEHFAESMNDWQVLAETDARGYSPLINMRGKDSRLYDNDLLSIIARFRLGKSGMPLDEQVETYDSLYSFYELRGNRNGALLMRLEALKMRLWTVGQKWHMSETAYKDTLLNIIECNGDIDAVADAYLDLVMYGLSERKEKLHYLKEAIEKCSDTVYADRFRALEFDLNKKHLRASVYGGVANSPMEVRIQHFGVNTCRISFFHRGKKRMECSRLISLEGEEMQEDTFYFALPPGKYRMDVCGGGVCDSSDLTLSSMKGFFTSLKGAPNVVTAVDGFSGEPIRGACVMTSEYDMRNTDDKPKGKKLFTDKYGQTFLAQKNESMNIHIDNGDFDKVIVNGFYQEMNNKNGAMEFKIFTDRSVYRPGQIVKASSLIYSYWGDEVSAIDGYEHALVLRDANFHVVSKKTVRTNDMGSAFSEFLLPESGLTGRYYIEFQINDERGRYVIKSRVPLRVEEYKRPAFYVDMDMKKAEYTLGDTVDFEGCAMNYNGTPVQNATVTYTVENGDVLFWYRHGINWEQVTSGTLTTDDNGMFSIPVCLEPENLNINFEIKQFRVTANVKSMTGETHSGSHIVSVSRNSFGLNAEVPEVIRIDEESDSIMPRAVNLQNKELCVKGKYIVRHIDYDEFHKVCDGTNYRKTEFVEKKNVVAMGDFTTGKPLPAKLFASYKPGYYEIELMAEDILRVNEEMKIDTISEIVEFALFSSQNVEFDASSDFFYSSADKFSISTPVDIYFKSKYDDVYIYWFVVAENGVVEQGHERLKDKMKHFRYEYKPIYGDGITFSMFYVKEGEVFYYDRQIRREKPNKNLTLRWNTFRDRLVPGQKEEWTLKIVDAEGRNVSAEVMATLYDYSLDAISRHEWSPLSFYSYNIPNIVYSDSKYTNGRAFTLLNFPVKHFDIAERVFDDFMRMPVNTMSTMYGEKRIGLSMVRNNNVMMMKSANYSNRSVVESEESLSDVGVAKSEQNDIETVTMRENFSETAFFYPQLLSDENGNVTLKFTLPESLTTWRFMALAHTKDMKFGDISAKITASKDFMVMPNLPRFLRADDVTDMPVSLVNRTTREMEGKAEIKIINPKNDVVLSEQIRTFVLAPKQTVPLTFRLECKWDVPYVICQIKAQSDDCGDGERVYLPVLGNDKRTTVAMPYVIEHGENYEVKMSELFPDGSVERSLSIEHCDNPVNYTFMTLGQTTSTESEDALSLVSAYFSQGVTAHLVETVPEISTMIESIARNSKTNGAGNSPLEQKQNFKEIKFHESPWVNEAEYETSRLHFLKNLVDKNAVMYMLSQTADKLSSLQNEDGSWSWFKGMPGNVYITMSVVERLAELEAICGETTMHRNLLRGMNWLDNEEMKRYAERKKNKVENQKAVPSELSARYLYVSSLVDRMFSAEQKNMIEEYLDAAEKNISKTTIYGRANLACAMHAYGRKSIASDFVRSLRQHTVYNRINGRYFDVSTYNVTWCDYNMTAHLAAMKAMHLCRDEFDDSQKYLDEMLKWAVLQKRTQMWSSSYKAVSVAEAMISYSSEYRPSGESETDAVLNINEDILPMESNGLTSVFMCDESDIQKYDKNKSASGTIKVHNGKSSMAWGTVYAQSMGDIRNISATPKSNPLRIERKIYVERLQEGKNVWVENPDVFHVGEKVRIRYSLTASTGMDFIQVRASHPSTFEHVKNISGPVWQDGTCAYVAPHDAYTDMFFSSLPKGTLTFDQEMRIARKGKYTMGTAIVQSAYAPDFTAHTNSVVIMVE